MLTWSAVKRHIDCAWGYQNEGEVGEGIKMSGVPRSEIWVTSKLFEFHHSVGSFLPPTACNSSS
jgi:diketogulonate reductase-like aldo/keto reductase